MSIASINSIISMPVAPGVQLVERRKGDSQLITGFARMLQLIIKTLVVTLSGQIPNPLKNLERRCVHLRTHEDKRSRILHFS